MLKTLCTSFAIAMIATLGLLGGCSDSATSPNAGTGQIKVNLIDAPGDYQQVNVEVVRVEVHRSGADSTGGWSVISEDTTMVDLLTLTNGISSVLADTTLPAGHYTQVRLILGSRNTVMIEDTLHDLEIPSSMNTGLKLNHPFTIEDGALYEFTLDFDAQRSIHMTGNGRYKMRPVIRLVVNRTSGSLRGAVLPVAARALVWAVVGPDSAAAWADTLTGEFRFGMLAAGTYDIHIAATAGAYRDTSLVAQTVTAGQMTDLGTVQLAAE